VVKSPPVKAEDIRDTWVRSVGQEDTLEEGMATRSSIFAWRVPWTEKPVGLKSIGSQRARHDRNNLAHTHTHSQVSTSSSLYINIIAHLCYQKYHILYLILKLTFPTQIFSSSIKIIICYTLFILIGI